MCPYAAADPVVEAVEGEGSRSFIASPWASVTAVSGMAVHGLDLRVLDAAGPAAAFAGRVLVGLGADVLRLEPPGGDPLRQAAPAGLPHLHLNAGKAAMLVDPAEDGQAFFDLLARADVLIDTGEFAGMRLEPEELRGHNPALVQVTVVPFGRGGPRESWRATDLVACAAGGMASLSGYPDGPPLAPPREQAYHLGGMNAAVGALLGLRARRHTGRGQHIEVALQECVAAALEYGALLYLHAGRVHHRDGDRYPHVPHRIFRCRDGYVAGGYGGSPRMWHDLLAWMAEHDAIGTLGDERWQDETVRFRERDLVFAEVEAFTRRFGKDEFFHEAQRRQLPWASVDEADELLANPQLEARGAFVQVDTPAGVVRDVGFGFPFPHGERPDRLAAPDQPTVSPPPSWRAPRAAPSPSAPANRGGGALAGTRILDLTWVLAGPYATMILADHGADVIKVESRHRPDPTRFSPVMHLSPHDVDDPDTGGYFNNFNRNKRSITINLKHPQGLRLLRELVRHCDVLVENFSAGTLARWGLDGTTIRRLNPELIVVSMAGMGQSGPWRDYVSYADALTALSTLTAQTAEDGRRPAGITFGLADIIAAMHGACAVVAALEYRDQTGEGQHIDLAQLEAVVAHTGTTVLEVDSDIGPRPGGNRHPGMAPHGVWPCRGEDRWCAITVETDRQWLSLCGVLGLEDLGSDSELADLAGRKKQEDLIGRRLSAKTRSWDSDDLASALQKAGVPAATVADGRHLVERDPQLRPRGFYVTLDHPKAGKVVHEGVPICLSATPAGVLRPAPCLGEHTAEVLLDLLGVGDAEYRELEAAGVLE